MPDDRRAVAIEADAIDLEDLKRAYRPPSLLRVDSVVISPDLTITALLADEFQTITDSDEVYAAARLIAARMPGILFAQDPKRSIIRVSGAYHLTVDDKWVMAPIIARGVGVITMEARVRAYAETLDPDGSVQAGPPPIQPAWLKDANEDDTVADVLRLLSGEADWFTIYMAFELMRDSINRAHGSKPEWPSTNHFRQSATVYRHSRAKWPPGYDLQSATPVAEARQFISRLPRTWLEWRMRAPS